MIIPINYSLQRLEPIEGESKNHFLMFRLYINFGKTRTPQKVADEIGCTRRHVYAVMKKYNWKDRIADYQINESKEASYEKAQKLNNIIEHKAEIYLTMMEKLLDVCSDLTQAQMQISLDKLGVYDFFEKAGKHITLQTKAVSLLEKIEAKLQNIGTGMSPENIEHIEMQEIEREAQNDRENLEALTDEVEAHIKEARLTFYAENCLENIEQLEQYQEKPEKSDNYMNKYEQIPLQVPIIRKTS